MPTSIKKLKLPIVLITFWALTFGFLCMGIFHKASMNMPMMDNSSMTSQNEQPCCGSTVSQHFNTWKSVLLVVPQQVRDNLLLLLFGLIATLVFAGWPFRYRSPDIKTSLLWLYVKENPDIALFDHLRLAFARGILNPKIY
jgi:hypothetical protein